MVAATGDHAAVTTTSSTENPPPLLSLALLDGARTTDVAVAPLGLTDVSSMAVLDDGRTLLVDGDGSLLSAGSDNLTPVPTDVRLVQLETDGVRLWATSTDDHDPLLVSDDGGETWSEETMPGLG